MRDVEALHLDAGERLAAFGADDGVAGQDLGLGVGGEVARGSAEMSARTSTMATIAAPASRSASAER